MADKNIGSLPAAASFDDSSKLIAEQQGEAVQVAGALLREFAETSGAAAGKTSGAEAGATAGYNAAKTITKGDPGEDGQDGVSPTVETASITGGHRVTITDANGTKTFDVMDGSNGKDGADGKDGVDGYTPVKGVDYTDGQDGISPKVTVSLIDGGHRVAFTSAYGDVYFDVMDGQDGQDGKDGNGVPDVSTADNGKVLSVVDGQIALVTPSYPVVTQNGTVLTIE